MVARSRPIRAATIISVVTLLLVLTALMIQGSVLLVLPTEVSHELVIVHLLNHLERGAWLTHAVHLVKLVLSRDDLIHVLDNPPVLTRMSGETPRFRGRIEYLAHLLLLLVLLAIAIGDFEDVPECLGRFIIVFLAGLPLQSLFLLLVILGRLDGVDVLQPKVVSSSLWGGHDTSLSESLEAIEQTYARVFIQLEAGCRR